MVLVQALFAGMHTTASPALKYIPPVAFCALRLLLALPFLGWLAHREGGRWFKPKDFLFIVPMGAAIGTAYALIFVCNNRSGPNVTAMVQPAMPICTTILSALLGLETVTSGKAVGLVIATAGTAVTLRVLEIKMGASLVDAVLLLTQANAYAVYVVLLTLVLKQLDDEERRNKVEGNREKAERAQAGESTASQESEKTVDEEHQTQTSPSPPGPMRFLFAATVVAEIGVVGFAVEDLARNIEWGQLPLVAIGAVLYAGLASSCLAHGLNSWAISKVQGILPTVYSGVQVVFTVVFSFLFLGHPVGWDRAAGSAVTVFGVYLVSRAKFSERKPTRKRTENVATDNDATNVSSNAHDDIPLRRVELRRISVDYIAVTVELAR
tara:strand:+ start:2637 stop:3779 length:1143 start_codon:yes stop_codon:yes gene_type:complete